MWFLKGAPPDCKRLLHGAGVLNLLNLCDVIYGAHSAQVEMRLIVNGTSIGITHMGHDFVFVESPTEYPPGEASILLRVDGSESRWKVRLPDGISAGSKRVPIAMSV